MSQAWEHEVQVEASQKRNKLFPNMAEEDVGHEDEMAGALGAPFTDVEDEEEWQGWVDWAAVAAQTAGAGSSGV